MEWVGRLASAATRGAGQNQEKDNTGTNPVNFTYDLRFYNEWAQFPDDGGSLSTQTFELRWPLGRNLANMKGEGAGSLFHDMGQLAALRFKARYKQLSIETPGASPFETSEVSGIGDFDVRVLAIPYARPKFVFAGGLEAFVDTASNDALGAGRTSLGPVGFLVFPGLLGPGSIFAPGYQYVFDITGDDGPEISRSQIDLFFVWLLGKGKNWLIVNPQIILDHESDKEFATFETEWGFMIAPSVGASGWVRPGAGIGTEKPYTWNLETGFKFVWR